MMRESSRLKCDLRDTIHGDLMSEKKQYKNCKHCHQNIALDKFREWYHHATGWYSCDLRDKKNWQVAEHA